MYRSIKDAAKITGLSTYCLRGLIKDNAIPFIKSGRKHYINIDALDRLWRKEDDGNEKEA